MDSPGLQPPILNALPTTSGVLTENPQTIKPANPVKKSLRKHAKKLVAGALMTMFLVGGGWFGFQEMQKRQIVEKRATPGDPPPGCNITSPTGLNISNITASAASLNWTPGTGGNYVKLWVSTDPNPTINCLRLPNKTVDNICVVNENGTLIGNDANHADIPATPGTYQATGLAPNTTYYWRMMMWKESGCDYAAPMMSFSTTNLNPSPVPSASPNPAVACVDLTKNKPDPRLNDVVTFTCQANFSSVTAPVAIFRHRINDGNFTESAALPINTATMASYNLTITQLGDYDVQCKVCADATLSICTNWGQAN